MIRLSDWYHDALVELAFRFFPAMDSDDMAAILQAVVRLTEIEVREARRRERRLLAVRAMTRSRN